MSYPSSPSSSSSNVLRDEGSAILLVHDEQDEEFTEADQQQSKEGRTTGRRMHLAGLLPVTRPERGAFTPLESRVFYILGGFMAMDHFNKRSNAVIPNLSELIGDECDIQLSIEYFDTQYSKSKAAEHTQRILQQFPETSVEAPFPAAIVGAGRSDVSETINTLSGIYKIPQVSPHSSAASLDDKGRYPFFARTTPSSSADGRSAVDYFYSRGVTHFGVIYISDLLGQSYNEDIAKYAAEREMSVVSVPYNHLDGPDNIQAALRRLKESGMRYLFAVIEPATWKEFIRIAISEGMIGTPDTFWLFHSGMVGLVPEELDRYTEYDLARAIHGSGVLLKNFPPNPTFDELLVTYQNDTVKQNEFVSKWSDPNVFDGFDFRYPGPNYPQYINYDAVISLGLAACQTDKYLFTGEELFQSLLHVQFDGASSFVSFNNVTGTRKSVPFKVDNILMVEKDSKTLGFVQKPASLVDGLGQVTTLEDFVYWDNTTTAPLPLPEVDHDLDLVPTSLLAIGLTFCAIAMLMSVVWACWVWFERTSKVVKFSQPFFLLQLCLGCLVLASSIIPMSLQEPVSQQGLNIACMSTPWLVFCGYAIAFSALVAKMWRINKIFASGAKLQRVKVTTSDASWPLVVLLTLNVFLLAIWTAVSPLVWVRTPVEDSVDRFGRPTSSYGSCLSEDETVSKIIVSLLAVVNSAGLIFTNYQGFKTRRLPTEFNEAFYLSIANACILEVLVLGIPILILADDSPSASFVVKALMTTVLCLCILLPLFVPKCLQSSMEWKEKRRSMSMPRSSLRSGSIRFQNNNTSQSAFSQSRGSVRVSGSFHTNKSDREMDSNDTALNSREDGENEKEKSALMIIRHRDYYIQRNLDCPEE
mmetsp:Transcript_49722/g.120531  ORF Transcript_49722/g.120531 Transcript_49722/m.120531 type:complete len:870 (+) Transcript_49722:265-2874(+)